MWTFPDDGVGPLAAESRGEVLSGCAAQGDKGGGGGVPDGLGEEPPRHPVRAGEVDGFWERGGTCRYDVSTYFAVNSLGSMGKILKLPTI